MKEIEVIFDLSEQTPIEAEFEVLEPPSLDAEFLITFTPSRVSELENDAHYVNETQLNQSITDVRAEFNNEIEYVRDDVSDLNKSLIENVTTLDNKIDTVNQELTSDIDTLASDVAKDINALSSEVASKYNTLSGLISTETNNRVQADNNLQNQINSKQPLGDYATNTRVNAVASDVALNKNQIEVAFDTIADDKAELKADIDGLATDIEALDGKIEVNTTNITSLNNTKANQSDLNITNNNLVALTGDVENLSAEIDTKQPIINDLSTIRSNAQAGKTASDTISTYGNIVTHNANEFQPTGDYALKSEIPKIPSNISAFNNDVGYLTEHQSLSNYYNKSEVDAKVSSVYRVCGSVSSFENLPKNAVKGDVYNVLDTGANYVWTGSEWDKLSETVDLTPYLTKNEASNTYQLKGNYALKSELPVVPTDISAFNNDSGYITASYHDVTKQDVISDLSTIRTNASNGNSAYTTIDTFGNIVTHNADDFLPSSTKIADLTTDIQLNAINSGITSNKISNYDTHINNGTIHVTASDKVEWSKKQPLISDLDTIRAGASLGATALQSVPSEYITETELSAYHDSSKQDVISDLSTIRANANLGATALQVEIDPIYTADKPNIALKSEIPDVSKLAIDTSVVHKANAETITGIKTFNGGKGGNDVGIISLTGMLIGAVDKTAYTQYGTIRNCDGKANTGSYYINSDGSLLFRHKTGTATAEGTVNDAMLTLHPVNGLKVGWSGQYNVSTTADKDVLVDTIQYSKLTTTAKDVLGAINEVKGLIPSLTGYATESFVISQGYITSAALNGYATESFVTSQGYITSSYHDSTKQNVINDLDSIRSGASKGATAIQQVKTINNESIVGSGNITIESGNNDFIAEYGVTTWQEIEEAYNAGKNCYCRYNSYIYRLSAKFSQSISFDCTQATSFRWLYCNINDTWSNSNYSAYTEIENKVDKTGSEVANTRFDGQWQVLSAQLTLSTATAIGEYDIDLVSTIPNDGYSYEILLRGSISRGDSSGTNSAYNVQNLSKTITWMELQNDGANFQQFYSSCIAILPTNERKIHLSISKYKLTDAYLRLLAYRRVGTNE